VISFCLCSGISKFSFWVIKIINSGIGGTEIKIKKMGKMVLRKSPKKPSWEFTKQ